MQCSYTCTVLKGLETYLPPGARSLIDWTKRSAKFKLQNVIAMSGTDEGDYWSSICLWKKFSKPYSKTRLLCCKTWLLRRTWKPSFAFDIKAEFCNKKTVSFKQRRMSFFSLDTPYIYSWPNQARRRKALAAKEKLRKSTIYFTYLA